jgi:hypothetical protein
MKHIIQHMEGGVCLECMWLLSICVNPHDLLYIEKKIINMGLCEALR